jgi:hypothetical protein
LALVPAHFELSAVSQVPVLDLGISRAIGLLWSREREHADLKEFIEFAGEHCWARPSPRPSSMRHRRRRFC